MGKTQRQGKIRTSMPTEDRNGLCYHAYKKDTKEVLQIKFGIETLILDYKNIVHFIPNFK